MVEWGLRNTWKRLVFAASGDRYFYEIAYTCAGVVWCDLVSDRIAAAAQTKSVERAEHAAV